MITQIRSQKEYDLVMKSVEALLRKATRLGGFHRLPADDAVLLGRLSRLAEAYEDKVMRVMPVQPRTLQEAISLRQRERNLTQAALAKLLGIRPPKLSQILSGKRKADVAFLKAVHRKLNLDAAFVLDKA